MTTQTNQPRPPGADAISSGSGDPRLKAQEMVGQAQDKAQEMARQAQESARAAAEQVQGGVRDQLDRRSAQAAEQINSHASDLRAVGNSLREQGQGGPARAADRLAQYAERVGGYLQGRDSDALLSDAEEFARRQPWAVATGGLVLGFAASRFLKASGRKRYSSRSEQPGSATLPRRSPAVPDVPTRSPATPPVAGERSVGSVPYVPPRAPADPRPDAPSTPPAPPTPGTEP